MQRSLALVLLLLGSYRACQRANAGPVGRSGARYANKVLVGGNSNVLWLDTRTGKSHQLSDSKVYISSLCTSDLTKPSQAKELQGSPHSKIDCLSFSCLVSCKPHSCHGIDCTLPSLKGKCLGIIPGDADPSDGTPRTLWLLSTPAPERTNPLEALVKVNAVSGLQLDSVNLPTRSGNQALLN